MVRYGRDLDWYLGNDCFYEIDGCPRIFEENSNIVFEMWHYSDGEVAISEQQSEGGRVEQRWLTEEPPLNNKQQKPLAGLRLIICPVENLGSMRHKFSFSKEHLKQIMTSFNLPLSYLEAGTTMCGDYSTYTSSQLAGNASDSQIGFIISGPQISPRDLDLVFTWDKSTNITSGIVRISGSDQTSLFKSQLCSFPTLATYPLTLGYCFLEFEIVQIMQTCEFCRRATINIQCHTGHLGGFKIESEEILIADNLNNLTLQISSQGQYISYLITLTKSASLLCTFLLEFIDTVEGVEPEANSNGFYDVFKAQTQALKDLVKSRFCKIQHYDNYSEYLARLIAIQNQSVYNMIAQRDTQQNIELAKDSKSIAAASKRDSSAMKSIALLTMVVLPGTLISSIFAMPLFNWDASSWSQIPSSRFWFYWAITIPLTIAILIVWTIWQRIYERRSRVLDLEAREEIGLKKERSQRSGLDVKSAKNQVLSHPVASGSRSEPRLPTSNNSDVRLRTLGSDGRRETV